MGHARLDDPGQISLGRSLLKPLADAGYGVGEDIVLIRLRFQHCAIKRFDSLGFFKWRAQRMHNIHPDMFAADAR